MFEHEIIYSSYSGNIRTKKFSDFTNILIKTDRVASKYITVYIRGLTGNIHTSKVENKLRVLGDSQLSSSNVQSQQYSQYIKLNFELKKAAHKVPLAHLEDWGRIILVVFTSSICALYLLKLVKVNVNKVSSNSQVETKKERKNIFGEVVMNLDVG